MHRSAKAVALALLASLPLASPVPATQVIYKTPSQLGAQSSLVVRGTVANVHSYWNAKHSKIFTTTRVTVAETYKGQAGGTIEVMQLGGVVDGVRVTVAGSLQWTPGEDVVLFLEPYQAGQYHVSGFSQGKFNVEKDPKTGVEFIRRPPMNEIKLVGAPSTPGGPRPLTAERMSVSEFVNQALGRK